MKKLLFFTLLLSGFTLSAALSPLEQSITEIQTLLQSPELKKNLPEGESIVDIWKLSGRYIVTTDNRQMVVELNYKPATKPGPQQFELVFYPPKPFGK